MNVTRIAILGVAALAAGAAAFLVRGMLGGGTSQSEASIPVIAYPTTDVLVAASDVDAGRPLTVNDVRWQAWPKSALAPAYVTRDIHPDMAKAIESAVVRAPLFAGEPITDAKVVRADHASFMSAAIAPGKRAVSISISAEQGAGGFILPNDRVDVILTRQAGGSSERNFASMTILEDVRVLAIDQTAKSDNSTQSAIGKTATLELDQDQAEVIAQSQASGTLSLALRPLGEAVDASLQHERSAYSRRSGAVAVIRYGIANGANIPGRPQ